LSSHREAPETAKDPGIDSTDLYAFVSPDRPDTVTIVANYVPGQEPAGGPNFFPFDDTALYEIHISNSGSSQADITYQFRFTTVIGNPNTFLYNAGPITSLKDPNWNIRQVYSLTRITNGQTTPLGTGLPCPPDRIGPRSTPNYEGLAAAAVNTLPSGEVVFAGQRADPFYVDLGAIFDLGDLRPLQNLHLIPTPASDGVNTLAGYNVKTLALQVPIAMLTASGSMPSGRTDKMAAIGIWTSASRQASTVRTQGAANSQQGPFVQVSRLGNPLVNEVIIPVGLKDQWNRNPPSMESNFLQFFQQPMLQKLLPVLYPQAFPNLAMLTNNRDDLVAILTTGIPAGIVPDLQTFTGSTPADMLRVNTAVPPTASPNAFGVLGGDVGGFPNGRRLMDNVVAIELRAIAGATYPLVNKSYTPDAAASLLTDGTTFGPAAMLNAFPYVGTPYEGYNHPHHGQSGQG
jgi:Domain of unknown function (DUF4331)